MHQFARMLLAKRLFKFQYAFMHTKVSVTKQVSLEDLKTFAKLTGDNNVVHFNRTATSEPIVHGALLNGFVSGVIGTLCPGHGSMVISQSFTFPNKCFVDVPIEVNVQLVENRKIMKIKYWCKQNDKIVFEGEAKVINKNLDSYMEFYLFKEL